MKFDALDILIGRLFVIGCHGRTAEEDFLIRYRRLPAGGVILFGRNLGTREEITTLTATIQAAGEEIHGVPLLIAVDQEGGNLSPLRGRVTPLPGNMALAATGDPSAAYFAGRRTAEDLRELGFNLVFAPVLDLAADPTNPVIGTRSFGDDPAEVARFGRALATGLADGGVLFTAKHFPGHGNCREDSHVTLPQCHATREALWENDLRPFRAVADLPGAALMTAHVLYPAFDPESPATLSPRILTGLLRDEMGFTGVVITDDLEMKAIRTLYPPEEAAVRALLAGADLVLICHTFADQMAAFAGVKAAVKEGRLPLARLEEAVARVTRWQKAQKAIAVPERWETAWTPVSLAERAITMIGNPAAWSFGREPLALVTPLYRAVTPAEDAGDLEPLFTTLAAARVPFRRYVCTIDPNPAEIAAITAAVKTDGYRRLVIVLRHAIHHPGQQHLAVALASLGQVLLVSLGDPREVYFVNPAMPALCVYSSESTLLAALVRVLVGELTPTGKVPVRLESASNVP